MPSQYIPVLMLFLFASFLGGAFIILSAMLGRPKKTTTDLEPYECGVDQTVSPRRPLNVKFFIIAIVFLLFDVEVALLYPWAALFRDFVSNGMGNFILMEGLMFIFVLAVGLIFIFRIGALAWED